MSPPRRPPAPSLGRRLLGWLATRRSRHPQPRPATTDRPQPPLRSDGSAERQQQDDGEWLATYLRRIGALDERPPVADPQALAILRRLEPGAPPNEVSRLAAALATTIPSDVELQLLVAKLLMEQQLVDSARRLLEPLLSRSPPQLDEEERQRVRSLLAQIAEAGGEAATAERLLAAVVAEDWDYPGARDRLQALGRRLGRRDRNGLLSDGNDRPGSAAAAVRGQAPTLLGQSSGLTSRYRLRRELGSGGSSTVYLADDCELGCEVALKLFHPRLRGAESAAASDATPGLIEAQLQLSLRHPGVLMLYDFGQLSEGRSYLTMELCTGGSLRTRLALGPLPAELALRRGHELCATLQAVHQQGIVHGDLKPENLLFRSPLRSRQLVVDEPPYGDLLLSDFGTARRVGAPPLASAAGTRSYLSPERLHGGPPSAAADLYSLGLVIAELLSGRAASHAPAQALASDLSDVSWARLSQALGARQPPLRRLLEQLTAHEPTARPRADAALAVLKALLEP